MSDRLADLLNAMGRHLEQMEEPELPEEIEPWPDDVRRPLDIHPAVQYTSDNGEAAYRVLVEQSTTVPRTLVMDFGDGVQEEKPVPPGKQYYVVTFHHRFPLHSGGDQVYSWEQRATVVETGESWTARTSHR